MIASLPVGILAIGTAVLAIVAFAVGFAAARMLASAELQRASRDVQRLLELAINRFDSAVAACGELRGHSISTKQKSALTDRLDAITRNVGDLKTTNADETREDGVDQLTPLFAKRKRGALLICEIDNFARLSSRSEPERFRHLMSQFEQLLVGIAGAKAVNDIGSGRFAIGLNGMETASELRAAIRDHRFVAADGTEVFVTASFGVAEFSSATTTNDITALAFLAAKASRRKGRNRLHVAATSGVREID